MKEQEEFNNYVEKFNIPEDILYNREILDTNDEKISEEDFVEATFVYTYIIREAFAEYVDKTIK